MIIPKYRVAPSRIPNAGQGIFLAEPVRRGRILVAPDRINRTLTHAEFIQLEQGDDIHSSVRWFEQHYTVCPEWTDECYINHSFEPSGLWHLGFVFAMRDLPADSEVTMDYRYILGEGCHPEFVDSVTQQPIVGLPWEQVIRDTTAALQGLLK